MAKKLRKRGMLVQRASIFEEDGDDALEAAQRRGGGLGHAGFRPG